MKTRLSTKLIIPLAALVLLALAGQTVAQDNPNRPPWAQPTPPPPVVPGTPAPGVELPKPVEAPPTQKPEPSSPRGTIKVNVSLVNVLVSVLDDKNRPAPDLPIEAFQVFEEGVQQKIDIFESETKQPLDLALMVDASLSAHKEVGFEREAASHFIKQVLRPEDRLGVFYFDEQVTQIGSFSDNVANVAGRGAQNSRWRGHIDL